MLTKRNLKKELDLLRFEYNRLKNCILLQQSILELFLYPPSIIHKKSCKQLKLQENRMMCLFPKIGAPFYNLSN